MTFVSNLISQMRNLHFKVSMFNFFILQVENDICKVLVNPVQNQLEHSIGQKWKFLKEEQLWCV